MAPHPAMCKRGGGIMPVRVPTGGDNPRNTPCTPAKPAVNMGQPMQGTLTMPLTIRPLTAADEAEWRRLWTAYLAFYETTLPEEIFQTTFARQLDPAHRERCCFIADLDGRAVGLVHAIWHAHNWRIEDVCYLQDLYADPDVRGHGVGRALIEAVYEEADRRGTPAVYWMTQEFNATARQLYDRIAKLTPFIKYSR
jgi:GNAT superfamily N-acetyltransferase